MIQKIETEVSDVVTLPEVDYLFIIEAIGEAMPEEADAIMKAYEYGNDFFLGLAVRTQIEAYRLKLYEIAIDDNQGRKDG